MKAEYVNHAYVAGFIDGEGCFILSHSITLKVSHTHFRTLKHLQSLFGGTIREHNHISHKKQAWTWGLNGKDAIDCILAIRPFLIEKRSQADKCLEYWKTFGPRGRKLTSEILKIRQNLKETLREG